MLYKYTGPLSGVTLSDGTEIMLHPGKDVDLPEDEAYVKTLKARGYIKPAQDQAAPAERQVTHRKGRTTQTKKEVTDNVS